MTDDFDRAADTPFVTTEWLAAHLQDPDLVVIDGSWYLPAHNRHPQPEFEAGHIPGAVFFDIDALSDAANDLPHMLPDAARFGRDLGRLGIASDKTLVVYDGLGLFSAPRVWWTLRLFGARRVLILQGGLPKWRAEGLPLEAGAAQRPPAVFEARQQSGVVADLEEVRRSLEGQSAQVVDARPAPRFRGDVPEPRPGVRSGHMPGSLSLPSSDLVENGALKSPAALAQAFDGAGVDLTRPVVASCGSGVTAAIVMLAMETLGKRDAKLYDGSWAEYGSQADLPVVTGS